MRVLKSSELKTIEQLFGLSQASLKKAVTSILRSNYKEVVATDQYVYAIGDIPIALTAHLDTVFKNPPKEIFYDQRKGVLISPDGLGADDRAGVYAILQIIKAGYRPHIIFTTDEEIGCVGAAALAKLSCPFDYLKFVIELDRRGTNDCVFYDCDNVDFVKYISSFGFTEAFGTFTDICEFCPAWEVAGVNLSVGYRDEHSYGEVLFIEPWFDTIEKVKKILQDDTAPCFKYIPVSYLNSVYGWNYGNYGYYNSGYGVGKCTCRKCGTKAWSEEMFPVTMKNGKIDTFCGDCVVDGVEWCYMCGMPYEITDEEIITNSGFVCDKCKEEKAQVKA